MSFISDSMAIIDIDLLRLDHPMLLRRILGFLLNDETDLSVLFAFFEKRKRGKKSALTADS